MSTTDATGSRPSGREAEHRIAVDRLRPGVYVRLDLRWLDHPFFFNSFKIRGDDQIETLKELGLREVVWVPDKSDQEPLPADGSASTAHDAQAREPVDEQKAGSADMWDRKRTRIERLKAQREGVERCQRKFDKALDRVKKLMHGMKNASEESVEEADQIMKEVVGTLLSEDDFLVYLMNTKAECEDVYYHSLNVAVLALMVGREYGLDELALRTMGVGAVFHDIGKTRIPLRVLSKDTGLTNAERKLIQLHPVYGEEMIAEIWGVPDEVKRIVREHHERIDGSGYPDGLRQEQIAVPARIVSIANVYDHLTNRKNPSESITPYQALSLMFNHQRKKLDEHLIQFFIRTLGVYPPGTIVQLSDGNTGIVVSSNPRASLRPNLLVYDPGIPKEEALIINLEDDPDLKIENSLTVGSLAPEVYEYLNPRKRVSYFLDPFQKSPGSV